MLALVNFGARPDQQSMRVVYFHRKPRPKSYFSIENLFRYIRENLPRDVTWEVRVLSFYSEGLINRILMSIESIFYQREINHITGDIHFIAIFLRKKRTVLTIHDVGFMEQKNFLARLTLKWFWISLPVRSAAIITTVSTTTKLELLKYTNISPARIRVVYVPIDPQYTAVPKQFNKEIPTILQIGTKFNKNLVRLIQALNGIDCRLEIVGEPDTATMAELKRNRIDYSVFVDLTNREVFDRYCACDIVSFVSTYEGFGLPIVEANAVGRVVVTSNLLSMPEVAGDAAHLVDPFNVASIRHGILKVINDDEYRNNLIKRGFVNRERFNTEEIAKRYAEIYASLME
jgi:glycosyltransferase involved in cell wall biosynthesis